MVTMNASISLAGLVAMVTLSITMGLVSGRESSWARGGREQYQQDMRAYDETRALFGRKSRANRDNQDRSHGDRQKPNIIFVLTDDQDVALGSLESMPKTLRILRDSGANFPNAFVTTPICCPSRSSMLTGMYVHNHNVYTNNDNCSSPMWIQNHETRNFGTYLSNAGYRTGYFGKYLNDYDGERIPPGWTEWVGLIRNTRFYNYSLNVNGNKIKHGDNYKEDYLTDLIANDSVTFFKQSKQYFPNRPVAMVLSMPAPHGPEDAAPQYQNHFPNVSSHRTPSWNFAPNPDKQWLLQYTGKMEPIHVTFTDMLQRKRLQTLQSVDDAVEKVYNELRDLGELDNTYWLFTSDHGYHLGQYGLIKGKSMPYDFDVRVPFLMRGPSIPKGIIVNNIVLNVDIAPTFLNIAGVDVPPHMDGRPILDLFKDTDKGKSVVNGELKKKKAWRDTFLIERGKITDKKIKEREKIEAQKNLMILTKHDRLQSECEKAEYQPPCNGTQQWVCRKKGMGQLRIFKCRYGRKEENEVSPRSKCDCSSLMNKSEKKRQRQFLRDHVNLPKKLKPKFIRPKKYRRLRRQVHDPDDLPPVADPGPNQIISLPQRSVLLDGTHSTDDKGIMGYRWIQTSQRPLPVDMVGTRTPKLHLSNLDVGQYVFELTVEDTAGQISSRSVQVIVKPGKHVPTPNLHQVEADVTNQDSDEESSKPVDDEIVIMDPRVDKPVHHTPLGGHGDGGQYPYGGYHGATGNQGDSSNHGDITDSSDESNSRDVLSYEEIMDIIESPDEESLDADFDLIERNTEDSRSDLDSAQKMESGDDIDQGVEGSPEERDGKFQGEILGNSSPAETDGRHKIDDGGIVPEETFTDDDDDDNYNDYDFSDDLDDYESQVGDKDDDYHTIAQESRPEVEINEDNYDDYSEYYFIKPKVKSDPLSNLNERPIPSSERESPRRKGMTKKTDDDSVACRVLPNTTVVCEEQVYSSLGAWQSEKNSLDDKIARLKEQLDALKDVKQHLRKQRPEYAESFDDSSESWQSPDGSTGYEFMDYSLEGSEHIDMATLLKEFAEPIDDSKKEEECVCDGVEVVNPKRRHRLPVEDTWRPAVASKGPSPFRHDKLSPRDQIRINRQEKRNEKKMAREIRRQQKQILRQIKRDQENPPEVSEEVQIDPTRDCNSKNMKCFTHTDEHWKSAPYWDPALGKWKPSCNEEGLDCSEMNNDHWRVSPKWTLGPFCFCPNSNNNTYWCLRTINDTHNFLYCEFITGFISFYNMTSDPYQLRNAVYDLSYSTLQNMHNQLEKLKSCSGQRECNVRYRTDQENQETNEKTEKRRRKSKQRPKTNAVVGSSMHDYTHYSRRRGY